MQQHHQNPDHAPLLSAGGGREIESQSSPRVGAASISAGLSRVSRLEIQEPIMDRVLNKMSGTVQFFTLAGLVFIFFGIHNYCMEPYA